MGLFSRNAAPDAPNGGEELKEVKIVGERTNPPTTTTTSASSTPRSPPLSPATVRFSGVDELTPTTPSSAPNTPSPCTKEQLDAFFRSQPKTNPFVNRTPKLTAAQHVAQALIAVFIVPLRLLLFGPAIALAWICCLIASTGANVSKPLPPWRSAVVDFSARFWRAWLFSLSIQRIEVVGTPASAEAAPICVVNHTTFLDSFVMFSCHRFMCVAKTEVARIPFASQILRAGQTLLVNRTDRKSSASARNEIDRRAHEPGWPPLVIYPEGTW